MCASSPPRTAIFRIWCVRINSAKTFTTVSTSCRSLFRHFDPDCLDAYVEHGLHEHQHALCLRFDPATEISIYRNVPHLSPAPVQQLHLPLAMVRGQASTVVRRHHALAVRGMPKGEYHSVPGGHMFPLEHPEDTASLIKGLFDRWSQA